MRALLYDLQRLQCEAIDNGFSDFAICVFAGGSISVNINYNPTSGLSEFFSYFDTEEDLKAKLQIVETYINGISTIEKTLRDEERSRT